MQCSSFVELPNIETQWNTSDTNVGGYADSQARKNLNGLDGVQTNKDFLNQIIPNELAGLLEEVNIITSTGGNSYTGISTSANKLFPPCFVNIEETTEPQYLAEGSMWDYYSTHTSGDDKKRKIVTDATYYYPYWLASPIVGGFSYVSSISGAGTIVNYDAITSHYILPCWAW